MQHPPARASFTAEAALPTMASAAARTAGRLVRAPCSRPGDHGRQAIERGVEIVIDDDVIELVPMRHVAPRVLEPALDDGLGVRLAPAQPPLELGDARRKNEDAV